MENWNGKYEMEPWILCNFGSAGCKFSWKWNKILKIFEKIEFISKTIYISKSRNCSTFKILPRVYPVTAVFDFHSFRARILKRVSSWNKSGVVTERERGRERQRVIDTVESWRETVQSEVKAHRESSAWSQMYEPLKRKIDVKTRIKTCSTYNTWVCICIYIRALLESLLQGITSHIRKSIAGRTSSRVKAQASSFVCLCFFNEIYYQTLNALEARVKRERGIGKEEERRRGKLLHPPVVGCYLSLFLVRRSFLVCTKMRIRSLQSVFPCCVASTSRRVSTSSCSIAVVIPSLCVYVFSCVIDYIRQRPSLFALDSRHHELSRTFESSYKYISESETREANGAYTLATLFLTFRPYDFLITRSRTMAFEQILPNEENSCKSHETIFAST